jgi:hypothetical protein
MGNGFANRFLWTCVSRSKLLPEGGNLRDADLESPLTRLREILGAAHNVGEMKRNDDARRLWHALYPELSEGKPGMIGAVSVRMPHTFSMVSTGVPEVTRSYGAGRIHEYLLALASSCAVGTCLTRLLGSRRLKTAT